VNKGADLLLRLLRDTRVNVTEVGYSDCKERVISAVVGGRDSRKD
jgi:hypothetical protein